MFDFVNRAFREDVLELDWQALFRFFTGCPLRIDLDMAMLALNIVLVADDWRGLVWQKEVLANQHDFLIRRHYVFSGDKITHGGGSNCQTRAIGQRIDGAFQRWQNHCGLVELELQRRQRLHGNQRERIGHNASAVAIPAVNGDHDGGLPLKQVVVLLVGDFDSKLGFNMIDRDIATLIDRMTKMIQTAVLLCVARRWLLVIMV